MRIPSLLLTLLFPLILWGEGVSLEFLRDKPAGIARDFYIWQFLDQEISPVEANEAYKLVHKMNPKIFGRYYKKGDNKTLARRTICERLKLEELLKQEPQCIGYALKLNEAVKLERSKLQKLSKNLAKVAPQLSEQLAILASKEPLKRIATLSAPDFAAFFRAAPTNYKLQKLNRPLNATLWEKWGNTGDYALGRVLQLIILNPSYDALQRSLVKAKGIVNSDDRTLFYLGLNALRHGDRAMAQLYFTRAKAKAKDPYFIARATFWSYLVTGERAFLEEVARSTHPNVYSIYAAQTLQREPAFTIVREVLPSHAKEVAPWDIQDPFAWIALEKRSQKGEERLSAIPDSPLHYRNAESHLALIMQREWKFQKHAFVMPYREIFAPYSPDKQALLYAIARQESHLIPSAISTSYALGMMQLMPFNVEAIAKKLGEKRRLVDMFDPAINLRYAEIFLRDLVREFSHPLFIAYAYNGGPGFTRRLLAKGELFRKDRALDPWYSLEMIPYEESRYYGTRVLANYLIYQQAFGKELQLSDLLQETLIH